MPFNATGIYNLSTPTSFTSKQAKVFNNASNKQQMIAAIMQPSTTTITFGNCLSASNSDATKEIKPETLKLCESKSIRPPDKLSPKDVVKMFDDQLNIITAEQIENNIVGSFDKSDRELVLKALQYMCQFANMESLNRLTKEITKESPLLFTEEGASLASNIKYLIKKKNFSPLLKTGLIGYSFNCGLPNEPGSILMDENLLQRLKTNNKLLEAVKNNANIDSIIYPEAWINGFNPFNQVSLSEMRDAVKVVVDKARQIKEDAKCNNNDAVIAALNEPIIKDMEALGLSNKFKIINARSPVENPEVKDIEKLLAPNRMTEESLKCILQNRIPEDYRQAVLEILAREAKVYSPRSLSCILKQQQQQILEIANKSNIKREDIYYYIPCSYKSYGMITMINNIVNKVSPEQIITNSFGFIDNLNKIKDKSLVVILDDFAGSGDSLVGDLSCITQTLKSRHPDLSPVEYVLAPLVSTDKAKEHLEKEVSKNNQIYCPSKKFYYCPGEVIKTFGNSDFYSSLDRKYQILIDKILFSKGWNENAVCVAFPYMGPDNNNSMFADVIAPFFSLNKRGIKNQNKWKVPTPINIPDQQQKLKELFDSCPKGPDIVSKMNRFKDKKKMLEGLSTNYYLSALLEDSELCRKILTEAGYTSTDLPQTHDLPKARYLYNDLIKDIDITIGKFLVLNDFLSMPENVTVSKNAGLEELYDKSANLKKILIDTIQALCSNHLGIMGCGDNHPQPLKEMKDVKDALDHPIIMIEEGYCLALQNKEASYQALTKMRDKITFLEEQYKDVLRIVIEIYNELIPFVNSVIENNNDTFGAVDRKFREL